MRIEHLKNEFKKINILPELPEVSFFNEQADGVYLERGMFKSPGFVKKKAGWMLESSGKIWGQELFIGKDDSYIKYDKTDGVEVKGKLTIGSGSTGIGNLADAGDLAVLDVIGDAQFSGTLTVGKTQAKCTDANADETATHTSADSNKVQGYTILTGEYISTPRLTANNIQTGTLVVSSSKIGIQVDAGGDIEFRCSSYSSFSSIIFNKTSVSNKGWDIYFVATGGGGWNAGDLQILPMSSNDSDTVRLGLATQNCNLAIHGDIACDDITCDDISCDDISFSDITSNIDARNITPNSQEGYSLGSDSRRWLTLKSKYVQITGSITIGSTGALTDNGTIYFSGTHFYGRISGAWVQLDNQ